jgi:hypothetical protein
MFRIIAVLAACALGQPALAQAVYKCTAEGKIEFRDRPCEHGDAVQLHVPPAPPAGPASDAARRDRDTLLQMQKLRLAQEQHDERMRTSAAREARAEAREQRALDAQRRNCAKGRLREKWAVEDRARLDGDGAAAEAARVKARRQAETLAVECPA